MTLLFKDFWLKPQLLKSIEKLGYTEPTQIQADVWNAAKDWANVVGQSQTGTGKTTAFLLPLLQQIDNKDRFPQVLIVAPTRELVQQIRDDIMKLTEFLPMRSMTLMWGKSLRFQREDLRYGPQFIVATPWRLIEFMQQRYLDVTKITHFVLDEVDRMLDMGFIEDVDRIWSQLPNIKQTMTFSATINDDIKHVITKHCPEYVHIRIGTAITVDKIDHTYIDMTHEQKFPTLMHLLATHKDQKTIIFAQTKRNTEVLARALFDAKEKVLFLNGDLDMRQRTRALRAFKEWSCKILVTTDVAARWLNMDAVELVVNFDVPREPESYIHRIGRTGRAGADGKAIMFVDSDERHLVMDIERTQKIKLKKNETVKAVSDDKDEYFDIRLDRPLPPSEKKRRMVARSLSRDSGQFSSRSGWSRGSSRGWFGGSRGRSFGSRDNASNSGRLTSNGFEAPRQWARESSFRDRPMSDAPRREYNRSPRPTSQFDAKPESRRDRNTQYGERAFWERRPAYGSDRSRSDRPSRSIGGYDVDFVSQQRAMDRDRFAPRGPRPTGDRPARNEARSSGWSRSFGTDRPRSATPRWDRPTNERRPSGGERPSRPRLSSKPTE